MIHMNSTLSAMRVDIMFVMKECTCREKHVFRDTSFLAAQQRLLSQRGCVHGVSPVTSLLSAEIPNIPLVRDMLTQLKC